MIKTTYKIIQWVIEKREDSLGRGREVNKEEGGS